MKEQNRSDQINWSSLLLLNLSPSCGRESNYTNIVNVLCDARGTMKQEMNLY